MAQTATAQAPLVQVCFCAAVVHFDVCWSGWGFEAGSMYTVAAAFEYLVYAYFTKQVGAAVSVRVAVALE